VDTLRADHLSAYGYFRDTSPNIQRLGKDGVLFDNAYAASSWSLPSHASLLTGQYPHEHGAETSALNDRVPTLPELLRDQNYRTGGFSANTLWFSRRVRLDRGFVHFEDYFSSVEEAVSHTFYGHLIAYLVRLAGFQRWMPQKRAEDVNRAVLDWIDKEPGKAFFAFLNYFDVHDPYLPLRGQEGIFARGGSRKNFNRILNRDPVLYLGPVEDQIDRYDDEIRYVDAQVGDLISKLALRGLAQNTIVIITSDHGEFYGEHGLHFHGNAIYRPVARVPLIISGNNIPHGIRVATPVSNVSIAPTILDMLGLKPSRSLHLPSLIRVIQGNQPESSWPLPLVELARLPIAQSSDPSFWGRSQAVVDSNWFFVQHERFGSELYNWHDDPQTVSPLATPEYKPIMDRLKRQMLELVNHD
jgi:arylsulfatase A-like enzyme